jgi:galactoside O-acetyltransferase
MNQSMSYYSPDELDGLGFASCGSDVLVSRNAAIHRPDRVSIGDHVRIDDFVVLTGGDDALVAIGSYVHIAAHAALFGSAGLVLEDFVGVSGRVSLYSTTDDYGGDVLTNPTVPARFKRVTRAPVVLRRHVVVGAGSVILPGVTIGEGSATGALTLVNRDLEPWGIYVGAPARLLKRRSAGVLELEAELRASDEADA